MSKSALQTDALRDSAPPENGFTTSLGTQQQRPTTLIGEHVDEFLIEQFGFVILYAECAQRYVEIGDGAGLRHAMRNLIARVKASAQLINELSPKGDD